MSAGPDRAGSGTLGLASGLSRRTCSPRSKVARVVAERVHTVLRGPATDQAALHCIINPLHRTGLDLIEVRRLPDEDGVQDNQERPAGNADARTHQHHR